MSLIIFFIIVLLSEIIGVLSGFGSSVFLIPLAGMFFDFKTSLALTSIIHIFSTSAQLYIFRKDINWSLLIKMGIPSVIFVIIGALLNGHIDLKYAQLAMGIFLLLFALIFLINRNLKFNPTTFNAVVGSSIAGFLAGLIGTGGAIRGATLAAFDLPKATFVGTSAGIDLAVDLSRAVVYLKNDYLDNKYYWYIPILFVVASLGAYLGKKLLNRIPQNMFKKMVLLLILSVGIFLIYGVVTNTQVIK